MRSALLHEVTRSLRVSENIGPQAPITNIFEPIGATTKTPQVFFVSAADGVATNDGRDPTFPLLTIQSALDKCLSGRGDIVVVVPGTYAEALTVTKDYVHLIAAVDGGYGRPDVTPTTGAALEVTGQGFVAEGFRFVASDTDAVIQRGNGFKYKDCVIDGDSGQAATDAGLRLKGVTDDDSYTASEGLVEDVLIRGSDGYGVAFDVGDGAGNQVGCTHNVFRRVRFQANVAEDVVAVDTSAGGTYSAQDNLFDECYFMSRNKATHIDLDTTNGASNTGNLFTRCSIWDDTLDTTAVKVATANGGLVGCASLDGIADGDALD